MALFWFAPLVPVLPIVSEAGLTGKVQSASMFTVDSKLAAGEVIKISPVTLKAKSESSVILLVSSFSPPGVVKVEP